jgi:hypothetical protein
MFTVSNLDNVLERNSFRGVLRIRLKLRFSKKYGLYITLNSSDNKFLL